ncbi:MAG: SGNH/GDSL hydrolase family protein [Firmicutes bacterium]|nr:SGNH/GDSL hydrolase family protein [Bacillota bacterium]
MSDDEKSQEDIILRDGADAAADNNIVHDKAVYDTVHEAVYDKGVRRKRRISVTIISCALVLAALLLLYAFLTRLLMPKYATDLVEGSMISQYYDEAGGHDVIFVGDCEVYANFSPMELYREAGITAWVRGSPQQLIWQSYYILEETFTYETPEAVVLNVNAMRYSELVSEAYNRLTIDYMRWSPSKVGIILASMTDEETFFSYVFPLMRYHSRFDELTQEDFDYLFTVNYSTWNGYQMNKEVNPVGTLPAERTLADYSFGDICWEYLDKIRELCEENESELILIKAPSVYPYWYDEYDEQIQEYADTHGLSFYNFLDVADEIGIDYSTDTYDAGLHLNLSGATKLSVYFADILSEEHGIADHRGDADIAAEYDEKLRLYDEAAAE